MDFNLNEQEKMLQRTAREFAIRSVQPRAIEIDRSGQFPHDLAEEMGIKAKEFMSAGRLVPDEVVIGIVRDKLASQECAAGFILDGFPRTAGQAEALDGILDDFSAPIDHVVAFSVDEDALVIRLSGRRTCWQCQVCMWG